MLFYENKNYVNTTIIVMSMVNFLLALRLPIAIGMQPNDGFGHRGIGNLNVIFILRSARVGAMGLILADFGGVPPRCLMGW